MTIRTEKEKMIAGELYFANDPELVADRQYARSKYDHQPSRNSRATFSITKRNLWKNGRKNLHGANDQF